MTIEQDTQALEAHRIAAAATMNEIDRRTRAAIITDRPGQDMLYLEKRDAAVAFLGGDSGPFPILEAEVGLTGTDLREVAQVIAARAAAWAQIGPEIDRLRKEAERSVATATSTDAIDAAIWGFDAAMKAAVGQ